MRRAWGTLYEMYGRAKVQVVCQFVGIGLYGRWVRVMSFHIWRSRKRPGMRRKAIGHVNHHESWKVEQSPYCCGIVAMADQMCLQSHYT